MTTEVNNVSDSLVSCSHNDDDFVDFERHSKVTEAREFESMQDNATSHHYNGHDYRPSPKGGDHFKGRTKSSSPRQSRTKANHSRKVMSSRKKTQKKVKKVWRKKNHYSHCNKGGH